MYQQPNRPNLNQPPFNAPQPPTPYAAPLQPNLPHYSGNYQPYYIYQPANTRQPIPQNDNNMQRLEARAPAVEQPPPIHIIYEIGPYGEITRTVQGNQPEIIQQGCSCCCECLVDSSQLKQLKNYLMFQVPFMIINILLALYSPPSDCMDKTYELGIYLRACLRYTFLIDAALVCLAIATRFLSCLNLVKAKSGERFIGCLLVLSAIKSAIWGIVQIYIFHRGMAANCSGGILGYGIVVLVIHYVQLVLFPAMFCLYLHMSQASQYTSARHAYAYSRLRSQYR